jgi:hypothetical protein
MAASDLWLGAFSLLSWSGVGLDFIRSGLRLHFLLPGAGFHIVQQLEESPNSSLGRSFLLPWVGFNLVIVCLGCVLVKDDLEDPEHDVASRLEEVKSRESILIFNY